MGVTAMGKLCKCFSIMSFASELILSVVLLNPTNMMMIQKPHISLQEPTLVQRTALAMATLQRDGVISRDDTSDPTCTDSTGSGTCDPTDNKD